MPTVTYTAAELDALDDFSLTALAHAHGLRGDFERQALVTAVISAQHLEPKEVPLFGARLGYLQMSDEDGAVHVAKAALLSGEEISTGSGPALDLYSFPYQGGLFSYWVVVGEEGQYAPGLDQAIHHLVASWPEK